MIMPMKIYFLKLTTGTLAALLAVLVPATLHAADAPAALIAVLTPTEGNDVTGTVTFTQDGNKVTATAKVNGLKPNSEHGFHIHEFGDISAPDGTSAGGHFNPGGHDHALPTTEVRHAGDFGNLEANADGVAEKSLTVDNITLVEGATAIIGRSLIVHADPDDGGQPTGNAGPRIAMGVIGVHNPADK
jgi:Cu-Zn family superoxide dismutase